MSNCIESGAGWTPSEAEASLMREQPLPPTYDQLVEALQVLVVAKKVAAILNEPWPLGDDA